MNRKMTGGTVVALISLLMLVNLAERWWIAPFLAGYALLWWGILERPKKEA